MTLALQDKLRALPAVADLLAEERVQELIGCYGHGVVRLELRRLLEQYRDELRRAQREAVPPRPDLLNELENAVRRLAAPEGRRAINATGILLHTGLGRAPLPREALEAFGVCGGYSILQTDLANNSRSLREARVEALLRELTGCEAATVVNNNAAATMLLLHVLAAGREVVVSRGQLIEIGGSFRLPDVMAMSGAVLREVGCTNRTHLRDYEDAISENTGALIHVHTSNYRVRGFGGTPDIRALAELGRRHGLPVIDDLGSGALVSLREYGLEDEPLVRESLKAGASVACFSGDKLICGPQSGIIVGKADLVARVRKSPFARMFRVDKLTLAGLESTLLHFLNGTHASGIPFYRMLGRPIEDLRQQAEEISRRSGIVDSQVVQSVAYIGSGSIPDQGIPSVALCLAPTGRKVEELALRLRQHIPSVFGRISDGALLLDMRTVEAGDVGDLVLTLRAVCGGASG